MDNKNIELVLRARLETDGSIVSKAEALGKDIATALEGAFQNLGDRIADKLIAALRNKMSQVNLLGDLSSSQGQVQLPSGVTPSTNPVIMNPATGRAFDYKSDPIPHNIAAADVPQNSSTMPVLGPPTSAWQYTGRSGLASHVDFAKTFGSAEMGDVAEYGLTANRSNARIASMLKAGRGAGVNFTRKELDDVLGSDWKDEFEKDIKTSENSLKRITVDKIKEEHQAKTLASDIGTEKQDLRNKGYADLVEKFDKGDVKGFSEEERSIFKELSKKTAELVATNDRLDKSTREQAKEFKNLAETKATLNGLESVSPFGTQMLNYMKSPAGIATGIGAVSAGVGILGNLPISDMRRSAYGAAVGEFSARDAGRGDVTSMLETTLGGGEEAIRGRATTSAITSSLAKIFGGSAAGIAAGYFGSPMGAIAGGSVALSGVSDMYNLDQNIQGKMKEQQILAGVKNENYLTSATKSYGRAGGSFRTSQKMGAPELSELLYGGGKGGLTDSLVLNGNLSQDMLDSFTQTVGSRMGGVFGNEGPALTATSSVREQLKKTAALKGRGFSNAEDVTSMLFQGESLTGNSAGDRESALKRAADMWAEAYVAKMDKTQMAGNIARIAAEGAAGGTGGSEVAQKMMDLTMGTTNKQYGNLEQANYERTKGVMDTLKEGSKGDGNDFLHMARRNVLQNAQSKFKEFKLNDANFMLLQNNDATMPGLKKMFPGADEDRLKQFYNEINPEAMNRKVAARAEQGFGQAGVAFLANASGAKGLEGQIDAMKTLRMTARGETASQGEENERKKNFLEILNEKGEKAAGKMLEEMETPKEAFGQKAATDIEKVDASKLVTGFENLRDVIPSVTEQVDKLTVAMRALAGKNVIEESRVESDKNSLAQQFTDFLIQLGPH